jgi:hypothetical protein
VKITRAKAIDVKLGTAVTYELDGGERDATTRLKARVVPDALTVRVPRPGRAAE